MLTYLANKNIIIYECHYYKTTETIADDLQSFPVGIFIY